MSTVQAAPAAVDVDLPSSPYPGLRPFEKREWMLYFGRETITDEIITRLIETRCVALHGSSGSGKSSLIRAGVLPRLEQEHASSGLGWRTSAMVPGSEPLRHLAEALAPWHPEGASADAVLAIRRVLNRGREAAAELGRVLPQAPQEQSCLLIDQFEEVLELARVDRDQAALFSEIVVGLAQAPPEGFYTVLTMRSDYLGACARFGGLAEAVNRTQYLLPRMAHADLVRAIREPAELYGGSIARDLTERLIAEARGEQDELPLIQHALMLLWREAVARAARAEPIRVTLADYAARGSLGAVLSGHADAVLATVASDEASHRTVELLFRALTDINADRQAVRRRRTFEELAAITTAEPATLRRVVETFRTDGVSFLRPYPPEPIEPRTEIDISHEALIRCWTRIGDPKTGWLQQEFRDGLIWRSLLVAAESFEAEATNVLGAVATDERERWLARHNAAWASRYGGGWDRVKRLMEASAAARDAQRARDEAARRREEAERLREQELRAAQAIGEEQQRRANAERRGRRRVTIALVIVLILGAVTAYLLAQRASAVKAQLEAARAKEVADRLQAEALAAQAKAQQIEQVAAASTQPLLAEFGWSRDDIKQAARNPDAVRQSLEANRVIAEATTPAERARRQGVTVEYFAKRVDNNKVETALAGLGFTVTTPQAIVPNRPSNSIWFGSAARCEDVKLVALTLLRAGVEIRGIRRTEIEHKKDLPLIQVGADRAVQDYAKLTVDDVRALGPPCVLLRRDA